MESGLRKHLSITSVEKKNHRVNICILFGQVADKEKGTQTLSFLSTAGVHLSEPLFPHLTSRKNTHSTYV